MPSTTGFRPDPSPRGAERPLAAQLAFATVLWKSGKEASPAASTDLAPATIMRIHTYLLPALAALCACSSTPEETTDGPTVARLIELTRYEEALQLSQELV